MLKCAIAYTHDSDDHRDWVANLAVDLMDLGIDMIFDQMHLTLGADMMHFMEGLVRDANFVLMVLTDNYKRKVDARAGGAGYEGSIISAELYASVPNQGKFIPLLRSGSSDSAVPTFLKSRKYLDLRDGQDYEKRLLGLRQVSRQGSWPT